MSVVKTGLTVHLDFSSAISCDDKGGRLGRKCVGDVLQLARSEEGCHHHCNQFRLEKLHPIAASSQNRDGDRETDLLAKKYQNVTVLLW